MTLDEHRYFVIRLGERAYELMTLGFSQDAAFKKAERELTPKKEWTVKRWLHSLGSQPHNV